MLHGWTEYDAIAMERQLFNASLEAKTNQEAIRHANATQFRAVLAATLVAIAGRLAPEVKVEQPRYTTAAHA